VSDSTLTVWLLPGGRTRWPRSGFTRSKTTPRVWGCTTCYNAWSRKQSLRYAHRQTPKTPSLKLAILTA